MDPETPQMTQIVSPPSLCSLLRKIQTSPKCRPLLPLSLSKCPFCTSLNLFLLQATQLVSSSLLTPDKGNWLLYLCPAPQFNAEPQLHWETPSWYWTPLKCAQPLLVHLAPSREIPLPTQLLSEKGSLPAIKSSTRGSPSWYMPAFPRGASTSPLVTCLLPSAPLLARTPLKCAQRSQASPAQTPCIGSQNRAH